LSAKEKKAFRRNSKRKNSPLTRKERKGRIEPSGSEERRAYFFTHSIKGGRKVGISIGVGSAGLMNSTGIREWGEERLSFTSRELKGGL